MQWGGHTVTFMVFLPKNVQPKSNCEDTSDKPKLKHIIQSGLYASKIPKSWKTQSKAKQNKKTGTIPD